MSAPDATGLPAAVEIYDTTLRDGAQLEGISLTVDDKLRIAEQLDRLGVHYIEGGWPGANPKDEEFFTRARTELALERSTLVAFGSTRRVGGDAAEDATLANLLAAETDVVCIVGKASAYHVTEALRTSLDEGVAMVADSVRFLKSRGRRVFFDAEHFFDGYRDNPEFSMRVLQGAAEAGADCLVLCDTNGGSLPDQVGATVRDVVSAVDCEVGVHLHNDTGCGVANALAGVAAGATQVQGTINGYGERVGNCDLVPIVANLSLKMGVETLPEGRLAKLTPVAHHVAELVNFAADPQQPYVGTTAFAHKAGLHTSAIARRRDAYEHVDPESVSVNVGHRSGSGSRAWNEVAVEVETEATVKVQVGDERLEATGRGNGPVNALDAALRSVLKGWFPQLDRLHLTDFKVRVLETRQGTAAVTRVLIDTTNGERTWTTIGVSENIIEASWQALVDSLVYGILHTPA